MSHCTHAVKKVLWYNRHIMKTKIPAVLIVAAFTGLMSSRIAGQGPAAGGPPLPPTPKDVQPGSITCEDVPYPQPVSYLPLTMYGQDVRIAYMDVPPSGQTRGRSAATGRVTRWCRLC